MSGPALFLLPGYKYGYDLIISQIATRDKPGREKWCLLYSSSPLTACSSPCRGIITGNGESALKFGTGGLQLTRPGKAGGGGKERYLGQAL